MVQRIIVAALLVVALVWGSVLLITVNDLKQELRRVSFDVWDLQEEVSDLEWEVSELTEAVNKLTNSLRWR